MWKALNSRKALMTWDTDLPVNLNFVKVWLVFVFIFLWFRYKTKDVTLEDSRKWTKFCLVIKTLVGAPSFKVMFKIPCFQSHSSRKSMYGIFVLSTTLCQTMYMSYKPLNNTSKWWCSLIWWCLKIMLKWFSKDISNPNNFASSEIFCQLIPWCLTIKNSPDNVMSKSNIPLHEASMTCRGLMIGKVLKVRNGEDGSDDWFESLLWWVPL